MGRTRKFVTLTESSLLRWSSDRLCAAGPMSDRWDPFSFDGSPPLKTVYWNPKLEQTSQHSKYPKLLTTWSASAFLWVPLKSGTKSLILVSRASLLREGISLVSIPLITLPSLSTVSAFKSSAAAYTVDQWLSHCYYKNSLSVYSSVLVTHSSSTWEGDRSLVRASWPRLKRSFLFWWLFRLKSLFLSWHTTCFMLSRPFGPLRKSSKSLPLMNTY